MSNESPQVEVTVATAAPIRSMRRRSLLRSSGVIAFMTLLSRVLGFARDVVIAHLFGAGEMVDAFLVAFKIPNFMRRLFAEGAFSQAFVPVLAEYRQKRSRRAVHGFINRMAGMLIVSLLVVTVLAELAAPLLISVFAPGFINDPTRFTLATHMIRMTFPYLLFISLTAFAGAILNCYNRFAVPAFTPVLLNITLLAAAFWLAPHLNVPIYALAWGVFVAGIVQLCFQIPFLKMLRLLPHPKVVWGDEGVRRVLKLMVPALLGVSVGQINLLIDTIFASFLAIGSVSWLYFSDRLSSFPLGVFAVAIVTVILPNLSRNVASQSHEMYSRTVDWALRCILVLGVPSAVGLFILAGPLLATLFQGKFGHYDVIMAHKSLMAFALGVPAFMLIKALAAAFYSRQNIRTPVRIAVISMVTNTVMSLILVWSLAHVGLALSTTIAAYVNMGLLLRGLLKKKIYQVAPGWRRYGLQLLLANGFMGGLLFYLAGDLKLWFQYGSWERVGHLSVLIVVGVVSYAVILLISGLRWQHFRLQRQE